MVDREIGSAMLLRPAVAIGEGMVVPSGAVDDCFAASLLIGKVGMRRCGMPLRGALGGRRVVAMVLCFVMFRRRGSPHRGMRSRGSGGGKSFSSK